MYVRSSETRVFLSVYVDDIKMVGKNQNMAPMWKKLMKTNPHHFLTTCTWDALSVNTNQMKQSLNDIQRCLSHVFVLEQLTNYRSGKNLTHTMAWSNDMEGHAQKCVERYCELANKSGSTFSSFASLFGRSSIQKRRNLKQLENCQKFARKLKC